MYYVDEYIVGYDISKTPSLNRWPISHGPFETVEEAEQWALVNLPDPLTLNDDVALT